jgi:hypothetical protein
MKLRTCFLKSTLAIFTAAAFVGVEIYYSFPASFYDLSDYFFANGAEEKNKTPALQPLDSAHFRLATPVVTERFVSLPPLETSTPAGHSSLLNCRSPPVLS